MSKLLDDTSVGVKVLGFGSTLVPIFGLLMFVQPEVNGYLSQRLQLNATRNMGTVQDSASFARCSFVRKVLVLSVRLNFP